MKYKDNRKKTWARIKEVFGKMKMIHNNFPENLLSTETIFLTKWKQQTSLIILL